MYLNNMDSQSVIINLFVISSLAVVDQYLRRSSFPEARLPVFAAVCAEARGKSSVKKKTLL